MPLYSQRKSRYAGGYEVSFREKRLVENLRQDVKKAAEEMCESMGMATYGWIPEVEQALLTAICDGVDIARRAVTDPLDGDMHSVGWMHDRFDAAKEALARPTTTEGVKEEGDHHGNV
jgi:hypothetical protein